MIASAPLHPKFVRGGAAMYHELRMRGTSRRDSGFGMDLKVAEKAFNPKAATEEEILARVLYRDGLMLVIDKPAGLSVHRGPKGGPSLEDYLDGLRYGLPRRPAAAHRLP